MSLNPHHAILAALLGASLALTPWGDAAAAALVRESFDLQVPQPPTPVAVAGGTLLAYELHLGNFSRQTLAPRRVEVVDEHGRSYAVFEGASLLQRLDVPAAPDGADGIAPGMRGVLYVELLLPAGAPPAVLEHRIEYAAPDPVEPATVTGGRTQVATRAPPVLGPPLRGGPWAAIHHPDWKRGHRRVFYTIDGRARIPGRFAIDWVRLDADGRSTRGDPDLLRSSLGHGAEVLAVADAVVASMRNDMPESERLSEHPRHALGDASGNYVSLDLGDGRFAFYEHLRPGSVRVAPGQRVARGEVIAELGLTGDGSGPHLHFHVADADSPLGAEGQPFVLQRFEVLGGYADVADIGKRPWTPLDGPVRHERQRPEPNVVVTFD